MPTSYQSKETTETTLEREFNQLACAIGSRVHIARMQTSYSAQESMVTLFWAIGEMLLEKAKEDTWEDGFLPKLSARLQSSYPALAESLTVENLKHMRHFAEIFDSIDQPSLTHLPFDRVVDHESAEMRRLEV